MGSIAVFLVVFPGLALGQTDISSMARTYLVQGEPDVGDIVSFETSTQTFVLASKIGDPDMFGVVVDEPLVVLRLLEEGIPLISAGETTVNVTTINGPIVAGDYITSSTIAGKGEKSTRENEAVIGVALEAFPSPDDAVTVSDSGPVYSGAITVMLKVGHRVPVTAEKPVETGTQGRSVTGVNTLVANIIKYILSALVVGGSVYVAFRNFGANLRDSIVSVGRNPLAKPAIQSMVVINTVLAIVISAVGLFIGLMILFVQL